MTTHPATARLAHESALASLIPRRNVPGSLRELTRWTIARHCSAIRVLRAVVA